LLLYLAHPLGAKNAHHPPFTTLKAAPFTLLPVVYFICLALGSIFTYFPDSHLLFLIFPAIFSSLGFYDFCLLVAS